MQGTGVQAHRDWIKLSVFNPIIFNYERFCDTDNASIRTYSQCFSLIFGNKSIYSLEAPLNHNSTMLNLVSMTFNMQRKERNV
jgi:hypothetical protein